MKSKTLPNAGIFCRVRSCLKLFSNHPMFSNSNKTIITSCGPTYSQEVHLHKVRIFWEGLKIWQNLPLREPSQITFALFGIWPGTYPPSLHFLRSKFSIFLTTYSPLNINVIFEGSLKIRRYSVMTNFKWKIFSNIVAFSKYLNF